MHGSWFDRSYDVCMRRNSAKNNGWSKKMVGVVYPKYGGGGHQHNNKHPRE
jgi:hypothetical protein